MNKLSILALVFGAVATGAPANAQQKVSPWLVSLGCSIHEAKAVITNGHSARVAGGTTLSIKYTQKRIGDFGIPYHVATTVTRTLPIHLNPGQSVQFALASPHLSFCSAWFDAGPPDLQVLQVAKAASSVRVLLRNNNAFFNAPASLLRVRYMKCSQITLAVANTWLAVPKGSSRWAMVTRPFPPGYQYVDVFADAENHVHEANENNNVYTEVGVCVH